MKTIGIYVHIPFCASKCYYCDFYSKVCSSEVQQNYVLSLIKEIKQNSKNYANCSVDTIFIGGGTPSVLSAGSIPLIINTIKQNYKVLPNAEITIEANPNSINYNLAVEWFECGVNRVSVGLQSSINKLLTSINRIHTFQDYLTAVDCLNKAGIKNINTDVMVGLPNQKSKHIKHTIKEAARVSTHISVYTLILEENTKLYNMVKNGEVTLPDENKVLNMFNYALKLLNLKGFVRYEVSNFCLNGYKCLHNYNCWKMHEYLGFGASAHGFINGYRYNNIANIENYILNINNNKKVVEQKYKVTKQELLEETIMLGLRLTEGINLTQIKNTFGVDLLKSKQAEISELKNLGLIELNNNMLTAKNGFNVLNQIILKLV